ncbi:MAG TPA: DUF58 domain-containing protein [Candidatus Limnocylindria bacterium]|nr:DUF58 domain-containing protein [Candidatus Limnocylindria bacterium]
MLRRLDGLLQGEYRTLFRGHGIDLADIREYEAGDDVRYIDWNVSARMDTPYVRQYLEDREVSAHFLLDLSPSVDFGTVNALKRDQLVDFVALLARLLTRHGNKIGAVLYAGKVEKTIPAATGRMQVLRLLNDVLAMPRLQSAPYTSVSDLIEHALRTIKRRSVIFLVSDFFTLPGWERSLGMLARKHEVIAVRLEDPRERELPDIGMVDLHDAETGESIPVDTHSATFRKRFEAVVQKREAELRGAFTRCGVDVLTLSTEEDLVGAVLRFAVLRKQRRGLRAAVPA